MSMSPPLGTLVSGGGSTSGACTRRYYSRRQSALANQNAVNKFTYVDVVVIRGTAPAPLEAGRKAWIIATFESLADRPGSAFAGIPPGAAYSIEFEDGSTAEVHES